MHVRGGEDVAVADGEDVRERCEARSGSGCSAAMPMDTTTAKATEARQCQRGGGWWRANLGVCDWQGTGPGKQ